MAIPIKLDYGQGFLDRCERSRPKSCKKRGQRCTQQEGVALARSPVTVGLHATNLLFTKPFMCSPRAG